MVTIAGVGVPQRVHSAYARARLTEACYEAAIDSVHPSALALTSRDEREWLRAALEGPVGDAVDCALEVLSVQLEAVLADAPPGVLGRFEEAPRSRREGWD